MEQEHKKEKIEKIAPPPATMPRTIAGTGAAATLTAAVTTKLTVTTT